MAFSFTAVSPSTISADGGNMITVTGSFEEGHSYNIHIGFAETIADPICVSGIAGQGSTILPTNGDLVAYSPRLIANVLPMSLTIIDINTLETHFVVSLLTVVKEQYFSPVYELRKMFAPNRKTGAKNISGEKTTT